MAVKTYRLGSGQDGNFAALFEADQTAASRTDGWTVAKIAATNQSDFDAGTKQVSGSFAISAKPASFITSTIANALKIPVALLGTFANTSWTFSFAMRAVTASAQAGRIRLRVFKASDAAGTTNVVELTGATQVGTTTAALSTSADQMTTVTWNPGVTIRLNNEFLFFVIAWEITTASGSNSSDVVFRTGQAAAGTRVVTPDFVANAQVFGVIDLPITFGKAVAGYIPPTSLYAAEILKDGPIAYWRMDEVTGTVAKDLSSSGYDLNDGSSNLTVPGVSGLLVGEVASLARKFLSIATFLNRGGLLFPSNIFSIEMWVKRTRTNVGEILLAQYNGGIRVDINADGSIPLVQSFVGYAATTAILKILDTNPHHLVITRNGIGGQIIFYLDGVSEIPTPSNSNMDFSSGAANGFFVGSEWGANPFDGTLDELAIYSKVLTPAQVQNHYTIGITVPKITYYGKIDVQTTFSSTTQGQRTTLGSVAKIFTFNKDVRGVRKAFSSISVPFSFGSVIEGKRKALGQIAASFTFVKDVNGVRKTFGQSATPISFIKDVKGSRKTFSQFTFPIIFTKEVVGRRISFGQLSMQTVFGKEIAGIRKVVGQITLPITFLKDVRGQRKTFGQLLSPLIFGKTVIGQRKTFGQIISPFTITISTIGNRALNTFYGIVALPITFVKDAKGVRKTFGQTASSFTFTKDVKAVRKTFGKTDLPLIFTKEAVGRKNVFGQLSMQTLFGKETAGRRKTFGQTAVPVTFSKAVAGRKQTFSQIVFPINTGIVVSGDLRGTKKYGAISLPVVFGKEIIGRRKTFGQVTAPFIFGEASQGERRAFSKLYFPLDFDVAIESGPIEIHGRIAFPIVISFETNGRIMRAGVILNLAESIYLGSRPVIAVYTQNQKVWPVFV